MEGCRIEGEILLDGENIFKGMDVNMLRKRVGMVFQKPNPFPMSIYDNIAFGPRTHGIHSNPGPTASTPRQSWMTSWRNP